jgi:uncharacterized cofD-like protein
LYTPKNPPATKSPGSPSGPLRIVAIGGGTGLSTVLHGLKLWAVPDHPVVDITAIVTVTDDGGSSGRLRRDFGLLPPGDIRNCLVALSEDEALLSKMFQYRFASGHGLKGHSFGNLFLTALTDLTGDFASAVRLSSEILASRGQILPSTAENVVLEATLTSGQILKGESNISKSRDSIHWIHILPRTPKPLPQALDAIRDADLITLGPGSLFTSVIPNLLVRGIPKAISQSSAARCYVSNLMGQPGETTGFTAFDHLTALLRHAGIPESRAASFLDAVVLSTSRLPDQLLQKYASKRSRPVSRDSAAIRSLGLRIVEADIADDNGKIRHHPEKTAQLLIRLARMGRRRQQILARRAAQG